MKIHEKNCKSCGLISTDITKYTKNMLLVHRILIPHPRKCTCTYIRTKNIKKGNIKKRKITAFTFMTDASKINAATNYAYSSACTLLFLQLLQDLPLLQPLL